MPDQSPIGPVDSSKVPRFAGFATFARLPRTDEVERADVAVVGIPFDSGVSYRPGARFGPAAVREASRLLRPYHPGLDVSPFAEKQVVDAGDIAVNPFNIGEAIETIQDTAERMTADGTRLVTIGGDHTIALPLLRAAAKLHGPVAMLHFDAHLDTEALSHVGTRGPLYGKRDLEEDRRLGFGIVTSGDLLRRGIDETVDALRQRIGDRPLYISIDIDVLDPAHAPGTGTPEAGGMNQPRAAGDPVQAARPEPHRRRRGRAGARLRSCGDHRHRGFTRGVRPGEPAELGEVND